MEFEKKRYDSSYNANDEVTTFLIQNHMVLKTFHCEKKLTLILREKNTNIKKSAI